jgi:hypothetical protein
VKGRHEQAGGDAALHFHRHILINCLLLDGQQLPHNFKFFCLATHWLAICSGISILSTVNQRGGGVNRRLTCVCPEELLMQDEA